MHHNGTKQKAKTGMNTHTGNLFLRQLYLLLNITEMWSLPVKYIFPILRKNIKKYSKLTFIGHSAVWDEKVVKYDKRYQDIWQYMDRERERWNIYMNTGPWGILTWMDDLLNMILKTFLYIKKITIYVGFEVFMAVLSAETWRRVVW